METTLIVLATMLVVAPMLMVIISRFRRTVGAEAGALNTGYALLSGIIAIISLAVGAIIYTTVTETAETARSDSDARLIFDEEWAPGPAGE